VIDVKQLEVRNNETNHRFEAQLDGDDFAIIAYSRRGSIIEMTHTEVPAAYQGMGIASKLVHDSLEYVRAHNLKVVPTCPTVAAYTGKHPEYDDIRIKRFDE
jgi:predicted GNAT family acetyltransferase